MQLDITFCKGSKCAIKHKCMRLLSRATSYIEEHNDWSRYISVAEFSDVMPVKTKRDCRMYIEWRTDEDRYTPTGV